MYYLSEKGLKESYINGIIKVLRAFFKYCESEQYINRNPMLKIKWQKEEVPVITTYTDEEVAKLIGAFGKTKFMDIRNKVMLIFFFDSGIRNRELCNIKLSDMHETYLTIRGKGKKLRHVPITPVMNKYLIKYMRTRESYIKDKVLYQKEYLFLSQKGKQLTPEATENVLKVVSERVGIRKEVRSSHRIRERIIDYSKAYSLWNVKEELLYLRFKLG